MRKIIISSHHKLKNNIFFGAVKKFDFCQEVCFCFSFDFRFFLSFQNLKYSHLSSIWFFFPFFWHYFFITSSIKLPQIHIARMCFWAWITLPLSALFKYKKCNSRERSLLYKSKGKYHCTVNLLKNQFRYGCCWHKQELFV